MTYIHLMGFDVVLHVGDALYLQLPTIWFNLIASLNIRMYDGSYHYYLYKRGFPVTRK
jgi:hypothetical protein